MYLLVIVTLIIGMLGIYAQVLSLQAARLAAAQSALGNNMVLWHNAAVSMAADIVRGSSPIFSGTACSLTYTLPTAYLLPAGAGIQQCPPPNGTNDQSGTVTTSTNTLNQIVDKYGDPKENVHLPADFKVAQVQFYSILYQDSVSGKDFVVTFVPPATLSATNPAPGYLELPPNNSLISYTTSDLVHQLSLAQISDYSYGTANSGTTTSVLVTPGFEKGTSNFEYNLPLMGGSPIIKTGSVAIVSSTAGF